MHTPNGVDINHENDDNFYERKDESFLVCQLPVQCSKLAVVRLSETTKKFTGQPIFGKIKRLVARGKNNGQPSQK